MSEYAKGGIVPAGTPSPIEPGCSYVIPRRPERHEHLCIPFRHWFRRRWICVRCDRIFRTDTR